MLIQVSLESSLKGSNTSVRSAGIDLHRYCIDVALASGATVVLGEKAKGPGILKFHPPDDLQVDIDFAPSALQEVVPNAAGRSVTLVFESLNRSGSSFCFRSVESVRQFEGSMLKTT